jgi:hypothetical protein
LPRGAGITLVNKAKQDRSFPMLHRDISLDHAKRALGALGLSYGAMTAAGPECRIYKRYAALSDALEVQLPPRGYIKH